jgi:hypothetical protein
MGFGFGIFSGGVSRCMEGTEYMAMLCITLLSARGESGQCSRESLVAVGRI